MPRELDDLYTKRLHLIASFIIGIKPRDIDEVEDILVQGSPLPEALHFKGRMLRVSKKFARRKRSPIYYIKMEEDVSNNITFRTGVDILIDELALYIGYLQMKDIQEWISTIRDVFGPEVYAEVVNKLNVSALPTTSNIRDRCILSDENLEISTQMNRTRGLLEKGLPKNLAFAYPVRNKGYRVYKVSPEKRKKNPKLINSRLYFSGVKGIIPLRELSEISNNKAEALSLWAEQLDRLNGIL